MPEGRRKAAPECEGPVLLSASAAAQAGRAPEPPGRPRLTKEEWRAKREARRAAQRLANVGRAAKMHAARIAWERDRPPTPAVQPAHAKTQYHIGCSGWYYWHWQGGFYPASLPRAGWFAHYAKHFTTVELNAPFYSWPTVATVRSWLTQAGERDFVYTVKVSELITHVKRFTGTKTLVRDFGHIANLLGPRMGCFLFQLPPSFDYTPARLKQIVTQLDPARRNVVEFRHKTWWNERVFAAFRANGIIFCACSGPRLPDHLVKTADEIYIRFHGLQQWYRHDYTAAELADWADRIKSSGAARVWAYFNNDRECHAIKNAHELARQLTVR
jgi:uncharacterized protein YecE (DUF72 family)